MSRNLGIIIIIFALLPIAIYFIIPNSPNNPSEFDVDQKDKTVMLNYSYNVLDNYFQNNNSVNGNFQNLKNTDLNYNVLFVTIFNNGQVRGCQSGSTEFENNNRILLDIKEATIESIEDKRFGGVLQKEEVPNVKIMFTFLYNMTWLYNNSLAFLENNIELGIHAIEIFNKNTSEFFKESVPISNNYDLKYTLERLCKKAGLDDECYSDKETKIYIYETLTFMGDRKDNINDLYRYNILINNDEINNEKIIESISSANNWYLNMVNPETDLLEYLYLPSKNMYSTDNNEVRQLASLWAITKLRMFLNINSTNSLINDTLNYYLNFRNHVENYSYLTIDDNAKLANNAFLILSLINTPQYQEQTVLLQQFANGILSLQNGNGSYDTYFFSDRNTGIDYYPGEAMLALIKLYDYTKDKKYLDSVNKAFYYYRDYWRNNKNTAFVPWHSQTYKLLFKETKDPDVAEFIFEMNDWIIDNYQIQKSKYPDEVGGFPKYYPTFSTSVYLEGINDAYYVAKMLNDTVHMNKYADSIKIGTRFVLQTQFTKNNTFYLENITKSIGGFKTSLTSNDLRIDNTQHSVMALMKTYENYIFN